MRKYIFLMVGLLSLFITGCGNEKAQTNENVSTVEVIKPDASYGEDMVTLSGYDFSTGYSCIKVYNPKTNATVVACGLANCNHEYVAGEEITCNAIMEGKVAYPFIYENNLYYFLDTGGTTLYKSNVDGSNKKKIATLDFSTDDHEALFIDGKIYLTSYSSEDGEADDDGMVMVASETSELYEVDIKTGEQKRLTDFGNKANISCFSKAKSGNRIYLGIRYQNKNVYDSEFKTWSKYTEWLTSCANPYAEEIEKFDEHSDYYCVDIKNGDVEKMDFNYNMTYEGMEDVKGFYDFYLIGINKNYYYYLTCYGEQFTLYEYDKKKGTSKELDNAYRMSYSYVNNKIYIVKTQYDKDKELGAPDAEDKSIPPEYRCYDTDKHKWTDIKPDYDMDKKILALQAAGNKYLYGYLSDFVDDESDNNSSVSSFSQGEMIGLKIKK